MATGDPLLINFKAAFAMDEMATAPNSGIPMGVSNKKLATDPPVSEKQRKAMYAALSGHSNIGISKSVAEKFVGGAHDMSEEDWNGLYSGLKKFFTEEQQEPEHAGDADDYTRGAGVALKDPDGRYLFVKRAKGDQAGTWAFPGGFTQQGESENAAAIRELSEELGFILRQPLHVINESARDNFKYTTFSADVDESFAPTLDNESADYVWAKIDEAPQPLHPGVADTIKLSMDAIKLNLKETGALQRLVPKDYLAHRDPSSSVETTEPFNKTKNSVDGNDDNPNVKDTKYEAQYGAGKNLDFCKNCKFFLRSNLAADNSCEKVQGEILPEGWCKHFKIDDGIATDEWAFDYSRRTYDADKRLHVESANISKANVCPYLGKEIPNWQSLSLQPDKIYNLLRDPIELAKAADSFNNLQILEGHIAVNAENPQMDKVVGTTGTDAKFEFPYLKNSLAFWTKEAIDDINSDSKKQLSCAYRYRADMTPGNYEGTDYDGVMRDIVGNHVALVKEGRAGADVVVGDSKEAIINLEKITMNRSVAMMTIGAVQGFLVGKLAQDAKIDFSSLKAETLDVEKLTEAVTKAVEGKLAKDAKLDGLDKVIAGVAKLAEDEPPPFEDKPKLDAADDEDDDDDDKKKKAADRKKARDAKRAKDNFPEEEVKKAEDDEDDDEKKEKAMDQQIQAAVKAAHDSATKNQLAIRNAEREVRPWVGELTIGFDSAEQVYRQALDMLGVSGLNDVHASALPHILKVQPKPGERRVSKDTQRLAMDSSASATEAFNKRFPGASRIQVIG